MSSVKSTEAESQEDDHHSPVKELVDTGDLRLVPPVQGEDAAMTIAQAK